MAERDVAHVLRQCPALAGLPARELGELASVGVEESHRARALIFDEGDPAHSLYVIRSGHVKIVRHTRAGRDVVLELLGPGEMFGAVAVIERGSYPAAAQASEMATVVRIPADAILSLAERHPAIIREIALMIGRRLRAAHDSVQSLSVDPAEVRLAAVVVRLMEREGQPARGGTALPFPLTRQNLADMAGTTVETAIRIATRWLREGLLSEEEGRLTVTDLERLRVLAEGRAE